MIKLDIDPWCENCYAFKPHVEKSPIIWHKGCATKEIINTYITCKYRDRCTQIKQYIEEQKEGANEIP